MTDTLSHLPNMAHKFLMQTSDAMQSADADATSALLFKLCGDFASALVASVSVSPVVTAMDMAITKNASGAMKLWPALAAGLRDLAARPMSNLASVPTRWLILVYTATYGAANTATTLSAHAGVSPTMPVLAASTCGNMSTCIAKDRAFARMYGITAPKPLPLPSYGIFCSRDLVAMAFIFSLPPIVAPRIREAVDRRALPVSEKAVTTAAQLATPVISQVFTTPLHLLGLSMYNLTGAPLAEHLRSLKGTYPPTVLVRMLRIIPAFSVGGVCNRHIREGWHGAARA